MCFQGCPAQSFSDFTCKMDQDHAVCPGLIPPAFVAHDRRWEDSFCLRPSEPPGAMSFRSRLLLGRPFRPGVTPSPSCCRVRCGRHTATSAFDFIEPMSHPCIPIPVLLLPRRPIVVVRFASFGDHWPVALCDRWPVASLCVLCGPFSFIPLRCLSKITPEN